MFENTLLKVTCTIEQMSQPGLQKMIRKSMKKKKEKILTALYLKDSKISNMKYLVLDFVFKHHTKVLEKKQKIYL